VKNRRALSAQNIPLSEFTHDISQQNYSNKISEKGPVNLYTHKAQTQHMKNIRDPHNPINCSETQPKPESQKDRNTVANLKQPSKTEGIFVG
jgi:hypothetical protein